MDVIPSHESFAVARSRSIVAVVQQAPRRPSPQDVDSLPLFGCQVCQLRTGYGGSVLVIAPWWLRFLALRVLGLPLAGHDARCQLRTGYGGVQYTNPRWDARVGGGQTWQQVACFAWPERAGCMPFDGLAESAHF